MSLSFVGVFMQAVKLLAVPSRERVVVAICCALVLWVLCTSFVLLQDLFKCPQSCK